MFFKKEKKYVGDYKNGKMHGTGTLIIGHFSKIFKKTIIKTLPRTKYVGEFKNDKMHGTGTFQLHASKKDSFTYTGEFKNNKRNGKGIIKIYGEND